MPEAPPRLTLADALIRDLRSGALSLAAGLRIIEVLRESGMLEAAAEIERGWKRATSGRSRLD